MDGDSNGENISVAFQTKAGGYRTNMGEIITFPANTGLKNEEISILNPQALTSMLTLAPDGSISSGGLPMGTYLSMAPSNGTNVGEQIVFTFPPMNGNIVDVCEELKQDFSSTGLHSPVANKVNGTTQLINGGIQTQYINIQGLNGLSQIMGIPGMGTLSPISNGNCAQTITNSAPHQTSYTLQPMPQATAMPQYILAGGQLLQGVQGAQIYIPQTANVAPQQILTIPMNQNANNQLVQLVTPNGQVITTTMGNLQAMGGTNTGTSCATSLPTQTILANNFQSFGQSQVVPQILTNSAGQILAVSPQIIGQPSGLMQIYSGGGPVQIEKQPVLQQTSGQMNINPTKNVITSSTGTSNVIQNQTHIQIATVADTSTIATQSVHLSPEASNQIIQVSQTSSPSVTSTESSTPISQTSANTVDGINLEEIKEFAKAFKIRRLSLGLTQTQVGQALSVTEGPAYSQSAICRFEKLDITPKSAQKIKPVLERWMKEAEERYKNGAQNLTEFIGTEPSKKRKRRTSFTPLALEALNQHFEKNTHPSGSEMTELAESLQYDREVVRVWFCNKRQTLKNTVKKLKTVSVTLVG